MSENLRIVEELTQNPAACRWFTQVLSYLRVTVADTGEQFTVTADGENVTVHPGFIPPNRRKLFFGMFDPGEWYAKDFVLTLNSENVRAFAGYFTDDEVSAEELYYIMRYISPVLLKAALGIPALQNRALLGALGIDTYWQQCLIDPEGNETDPYTVQLVGSTWEILPGYHGSPPYRKRLTSEKLLEFQRRTHQAEVEDTLQGWFALLGWYKEWLASVSVPLARPAVTAA